VAAAAPEQAGHDMLSIDCDVCILKDFQFSGYLCQSTLPQTIQLSS